MKSKIPVVSIVARCSNSGKTTLIEKLIKISINEKIKLGILKHHSHNKEFDCEGKDTAIFSNAGALQVGLMNQNQGVFFINKVNIYKMIDLFEDVDFIILEGFKESSFPKIEVYRKEVGKLPLCFENKIDNILAIATDEEDMNYPVKKLDLNNEYEIWNFLKKIINSQKGEL